MQNLHEEIVYPQPQDAFSSTRQRTEVYGLDSESSDTESLLDQEDTLEDSTDTSVEETQTKVDDVAEEPSVDEERLRRTCRTEAREDVLRRNPNRAVRFLELLRPHHRYIFVSNLLSAVFSFGDEEDAAFVASMFSSNEIRSLCYGGCDAFIEGFKPEIAVLEDTTIDVIQAYSMMALMLHATGLPRSTVTDIASFIAGTDACERFLDAYSRASPGLDSTDNDDL